MYLWAGKEGRVEDETLNANHEAVNVPYKMMRKGAGRDDEGNCKLDGLVDFPQIETEGLMVKRLISPRFFTMPKYIDILFAMGRKSTRGWKAGMYQGVVNDEGKAQLKAKLYVTYAMARLSCMGRECGKEISSDLLSVKARSVFPVVS